MTLIHDCELITGEKGGKKNSFHFLSLVMRTVAYVETWLAAEMLSQISPSLTVYFLVQSAAKAAKEKVRAVCQ